MFAVSFAAVSHAVYYNKDIFAANKVEVPATWEDFMKVCETLKAAGVTPLANEWDILECFFLGVLPNYVGNAEARVAYEKGEKKLNDEAFVNAYTDIAGIKAYPLLDSIRLSFFTGGVHDRTFVGFANFVKLFTDPETSIRYWGALGNTVVFFIIHMLVQNVLGILFAVLLTQKGMKGWKVYQTLIFIPVTFAVLVTSYLWKLLLNHVWAGPLLKSIGLSALAQPWLGQTSTALICTALVSCWQWVGIPTMLFVSGLQNISDDLIESADIAGANNWQIFWRIKLPILKPVVGMVSILTFVNNCNVFDIVYAMETANGAPSYSTDLLGALFIG